MTRILLVGALAMLSSVPAHAEEEPMHPGVLAHALDRLANTARVLYIAAHPDDENTRLLAYLVNQRHVTSAYLSITRGGGGQNLIGSEQGELLGVIRTEELLAARRLDAAEQRFTRMRDFGYSKSADETLAIWDHEEALADVVWAIRRFRPDVIITRFDTTPPNHGHHTASAILAREAFVAAADRKRFPDQLERGVDTWQAERLLHNLSTWRPVTIPDNALVLDVGGYDPRLGLSFGELAARSRSQHKSQGFGRAGERGEVLEHLAPIAGSIPEHDLLEGIDSTWARFGAAARPLVAALVAARASLDRDHPEVALPALLAARAALADLPDDVRVRDASDAADDLIAGCIGLFVRANAAAPSAVPGGDVAVTLEIMARRPSSARLVSVSFPSGPVEPVDEPLTAERLVAIERTIGLATGVAVSAPYWLAREPEPGRYVVDDATMLDLPRAPQPLTVGLELRFGEQVVAVHAPIVHAWADRVHGERERRFLVQPPVTVTPLRDAILAVNGEPGVLALRLRAAAPLEGVLDIPLPDGWEAQPASLPVKFAAAGEEQVVRIAVRAPAATAEVELRPRVTVAGRTWSYREDTIDYAHIPMQQVFRPAVVRAATLQLVRGDGRIGYVEGSGDTIAADLAHVGYQIEPIDDATLTAGDLSGYAAILVGIRAYNTRGALKRAHARLMQYAADGGTVVVQYNTHSEWDPLTTPIGPYPLTLGRGRVTDESATMAAVDSAATVLRHPNRLDPADFEGWVQERGLYFAETWDERYVPVFAVHDPTEEPLLGGVLIAPHGNGRYIYTGLAFFRQLPAGVPGAYRLLANLLAGEPDAP